MRSGRSRCRKRRSMARSQTSSISRARRPARADKLLKLPKYHYGGLGVRGSEQWNPSMLSPCSPAKALDRKAGDNSKAKWVSPRWASRWHAHRHRGAHSSVEFPLPAAAAAESEEPAALRGTFSGWRLGHRTRKSHMFPNTAFSFLMADRNREMD
jgi:hypothetical protein